MSIKKQTLKSKAVCKVTFRISKEAAQKAELAMIVGEFNNWDPTATPMQKLKSGEFTGQLELELNKTYEFRYLLDGAIWINDEAADGYAPTGFGNENGIIQT